MTITDPDEAFAQRMRAELDEKRRTADETWLQQRLHPVFDVPGNMHPAVADWFDKLVTPGENPGNLIMCGTLGVGKSWHLWKIFADLVRHHGGRGGVEIVTAYELKQIAAPPVDYQRLEQFAQTGLLLLDDVGSVRLSEWDLDNLFGIVDQRWSGRRPIAISSNALDLRALLGERIASRLANNITLVELTGTDRRRT